MFDYLSSLPIDWIILLKLAAAVFLLPAIVLLGFEIRKFVRNPIMALQQACEEVLSRKGSITIKNWTLYEGAKGHFVIFLYNGNSEPIEESEERFDPTPEGKSDAIGKFIRKVSG